MSKLFPRCVRTVLAILIGTMLSMSMLMAGRSVAAQSPRVLASGDQWGVQADAAAGRIDARGNVIEAVSLAANERPWAIQIQTEPLEKPIAMGEAFCLFFDARSVPQSGEGDGSIRVHMAKNEPYEMLDAEDGFRTLEVPGDWQPFVVCFRASRDFPGGQVYAAMQLAGARQRIMIRDLRLVAYGKIPDAELPKGRLRYTVADAAWHDEADRRIREHRQVDLTVRVIDAVGNPIVDAVVDVRQKRHDYAFGTFVGETPLRAGDDGRRFRDESKQWFNRVTLPRYWADWGTDRPAGVVKADAVAQWAQQERFQLKTHLLLYPQFIPKRVKELADDRVAFAREVQIAVDDALRRTESLPCDSWDAINELRDVSLVGDVLGQDYYASLFNLANERQPGVRWFINEYGILTGGVDREQNLVTYVDQIRRILDDGGAIEGIGLQGHFQTSLMDMPGVWGVLDRLAEFGLPIEITEFDIDTRDELAQADYTRDFLTAIFAHPATTGLTTWGFWQGDMWRPNGAMMRTDWSIKPNGAVWNELIFDRWWTRQTVKTDGNGVATIRVFKGIHRVEAQSRDSVRFDEVLVDEDAAMTLQIGIGSSPPGSSSSP